jgi:hypothetical protein
MTQVSFKTMQAYSPWTTTIERFIAGEFPQAHHSASSRQEAVLAEIINSRQRRLGPSPGPEALLNMQKIVRHYMEKGDPIPVLIPFGPKKPGSGSIDVAELATLKALAFVRRAVTQHYPPGLIFHIRLEDATGFVLEGDVPHIEGIVRNYCHDFKQLSKILGYDGFLSLFQETEIVELTRFKTEVQNVLPFIETYLEDSENEENPELVPSYSQVRELGFMGNVSQDLRAFLMMRYERFYPDWSTEKKRRQMAMYFSCALARRRLGATGAAPGWDKKHLIITFHPPTPDDHHFSPRMYYRTVPLNDSKMHIPPWRARGVLRIQEDRPVIVVKNWHGSQESLQDGTLIFQEGTSSVEVNAPYEEVAE